MKRIIGFTTGMVLAGSLFVTAPVGAETSHDVKNERLSVQSNLSKTEDENDDLSAVIDAGYTQVGTPYVFGGKGPDGFDCSGFISWAFAQADISIPSSTAALQNTGERISYSDAQPGDLVFFNTYKTNGHVGIYLGNDKFLGAQSSDGVSVASMNNTYWKSHFAGHVRRVR
ncbi:hypothetical protein GCM10008983_18730 [Lentibacillus halophilus]|uniref:NlpC/P60 domain-containing protein n=1 Tax=Lentibacillus halophilus TaxID=295065 RepID=A0ABP3J4T4_9BACI